MNAKHHFDFIKSTEVKNLHSQVKKVVLHATEVAYEELLWRRKQLKSLLDLESKFYEDESAERVKARIALEYMQRKASLAQKKAANDRKDKEFIQAKRVHQHMTSCYEIRQALRRKDQMETQACQLFQIAEHERQQALQQDMGKYWLAVKKEHDRRGEARERSEECLRKELSRQTKRVLDLQMEELERRLEKERTLRLMEQTEAAIAREAQTLEEAKVVKKLPDAHQYGEELRDMIAKRAEIKRVKQCEEAEDHRRMVRELQRLEKADNTAVKQRIHALRQANNEFLEYSRRMRCFNRNAQRMRNERIDELYKVDTCTKSNLQRAMEMKAEVARQAHLILKQQMCDQYERRLREEAERRENKILENRFVHVGEPSRAEIMEQRLQNRAALDKQIEELRLYHEMEKEKYERELMRAIDDPEHCDELAERYMRDGVDYLAPHHNWKIIGCPNKNYLGEQVGSNAYEECKAKAESAARGDSCVPQKQCDRVRTRKNIQFGLRDLNKYSLI